MPDERKPEPHVESFGFKVTRKTMTAELAERMAAAGLVAVAIDDHYRISPWSEHRRLPEGQTWKRYAEELEYTCNLLALLNRDGGQCIDDRGLRQATDDAIAAYNRLRRIETAVEDAGQLTADGVFVRLYASVWHPAAVGRDGEMLAGCVRYNHDTRRAEASFVDNAGEWTVSSTYRTVSECYSSPEAASKAAR